MKSIAELQQEIRSIRNEIIKLDDLANSLNTISYEIISTINVRVEREYLQ